MTVVFVGIGVVIGVIITALIFKGFIVGDLRVDTSDPEDGPYLFLELSKELNSITNKSHVILRVRIKDDFSQN